MMRMGDYKLIRFYGDYVPDHNPHEIIPGERFELYNVRKDIGEKNDLSKAMPEKLEQMNKKFSAWLKNTGAQMPVKNPAFDAERWDLEVRGR